MRFPSPQKDMLAKFLFKIFFQYIADLTVSLRDVVYNSILEKCKFSEMLHDDLRPQNSKALFKILNIWL